MESYLSQTEEALRFKAHGTQADWLTEDGQENDWTRVMMTELRLTAWESATDVKNRVAAQTPSHTGG